MKRQEAIEILNKGFMFCDVERCGDFNCDKCDEALIMAKNALLQEPIIRCKDCKHWHEWDNGTGSCHISDIIWVGTDLDDYCSCAEPKGSDEE